jgi:hypothetical protein
VFGGIPQLGGEAARCWYSMRGLNQCEVQEALFAHSRRDRQAFQMYFRVKFDLLDRFFHLCFLLLLHPSAVLM